MMHRKKIIYMVLVAEIGCRLTSKRSLFLATVLDFYPFRTNDSVSGY